MGGWVCWVPCNPCLGSHHRCCCHQEFVAAREHGRVLMARGRAHFKRRHGRKAITTWRGVATAQLQYRASLRVAADLHGARLCQRVLRAWRSMAATAARERWHEDRAVEHWARSLVHRVFRAIRHFAIYSRQVGGC